MAIDIAAHIAKLKAQEKANPVPSAKERLIFWGTAHDKDYLPHLKGCVGACAVYLRTDKVTTFTAVKMFCKSKETYQIVSTSVSLLEKLLYWDKRKTPSLSDYAGSFFTIPADEKLDTPDIEVIFIQPLKQLATVNYGKFMATRLITKFTNKKKWFVAPDFNWHLLERRNEPEAFFELGRDTCFMVAVDIETLRQDAQIRCLSYTGFFYDANEPSGLHTETYVLPLDSDWALAIMKKWNWELKAPKVLQNGKYDIAYMTRYNAPLYNYLYDTAVFFHAWYSELPKDLGFLNSFFIREATYWKDLSETNDLHEYYRYNALDTWGTGCCFLAMLLESPQWAKDNYQLTFPLTFPCHLSEMTGIARDVTKLEVVREEIDLETVELSKRLDIILGTTNFNVKSPPQIRALMNILGCKDIKTGGAKDLERVRFRHPLNAMIISLVLEIRKLRTSKEKYLQTGVKATEFCNQEGKNPRTLYALNPHGTDTSRLASKGHHFWTGLNIQQIPRGKTIKQTFVADEGFFLAEADLEQAESRDTAYIAGEKNLIDAVELSPDFHSKNASSFFGIPFAEIYDVLTSTVLNKPIRQLSKNVNHGANYLMGAAVLVVTMGEDNIIMAARLLGLNKNWSHIRIAEHLLEQFHRTYPGLRGTFYVTVVNEVVAKRMLQSLAVHYHTDKDSYDQVLVTTPRWTRYCFGNPDRNKPDKNALVAHAPQSLNAQTLNKAYTKVFYDIAIHPKYCDNFKLTAQVHDSIFFQARFGHEYLCDMVVERMEIPITIRGFDGEVRTFTVPAECKSGKVDYTAKYWSDMG